MYTVMQYTVKQKKVKLNVFLNILKTYQCDFVNEIILKYVLQTQTKTLK